MSSAIPLEDQSGAGSRSPADRRQSPGVVSGLVSPDHPSVDHPDGPVPRGPDSTIPDTGTFRTLTGDGPSERRVITSAATSRTAPPFRDSDGRRRPTPYESGLAAVARHEVHIERVWPMRSPSTGTLEESSSAYFQSDRRGTPPASIVPVEGLRMNQAFPHEPVMADRGGRACSPRYLPV